MRSDNIIDNNKKLVEKHNGLKKPEDVNRAILDVLTDISETAAIFTDLFGAIYGRTIYTAEEARQQQRNGGKGNG